jgi:uncharacterized membrane protein
MPFFKPRNSFDKAFEIGILLKGLDGFIEVIGGIFLLLINPDNVNRVVKAITKDELNTNPHDLIANHIVHWAGQLTKTTLLFGAIYLLAHGVSKLILVFEILRNHLWAYIGLIILTGAFIIYQSYEVIFSHSISLILLTVFDIVVVYLTAKEYKKQKLKTNKVEQKE